MSIRPHLYEGYQYWTDEGHLHTVTDLEVAWDPATGYRLLLGIRDETAIRKGYDIGNLNPVIDDSDNGHMAFEAMIKWPALGRNWYERSNQPPDTTSGCCPNCGARTERGPDLDHNELGVGRCLHCNADAGSVEPIERCLNPACGLVFYSYDPDETECGRW